METIATNIKLFTDPKTKVIVFATFDTKLSNAGEGDPQRAKHYVYKEPHGDCYVHYAHFLVPDDIPPVNEEGLFVSERVFFGKYRIVEQLERHKPETWVTVGEIVEKIEASLRYHEK